jgi:Tfp pilus assembly protein PilV
MATIPARSSPPDEAGFALIEVMVSALIAVLMTGAVIALLNASGRAGAEERHRSQAFSVAQEDQTRMRAMQISSLNGYSRTEPVTVNGISYTVKSTASFVNDTTQVLSCKAGASSADYVKLASEVSWNGPNSQRKPIVLESIMSPSNGSLDPTHGTLTFEYLNSEEVPISGVKLTGTGPSNVNGTTDTSGCVVFPDRPEGRYTIAQTLATGFVDPNGIPPASFTTDIVGNGTDTVQKHFDKEGGIEARFSVKNYSGSLVSAKSDSAILFQNQWTGAQEKLYGTPAGTSKLEFLMKPLYPFPTSSYSVWAGGCVANKPTSGASPASVTVTRETVSKPVIQLPALYATVTGENTSGAFPVVNTPRVTVEDEKCQYSSRNVKRTMATNSSGQLNEPGLPWSTYKICASASITTKKTSTSTAETKMRNAVVEKTDVHSIEGTPLELRLTKNSPEGACP